MCATIGTGEQSITSYAPTDEMQQLEAACDRRNRQPTATSDGCVN